MTSRCSMALGPFEFFDVLSSNKVCSEILSGFFNNNNNNTNNLQKYNTSFI